MIEQLAEQHAHVPVKDVENAVKETLNKWPAHYQAQIALRSVALVVSRLHFRSPRTGRNPKTGDTVELEGKHVPHFKPRQRVTRSRKREHCSYLVGVVTCLGY